MSNCNPRTHALSINGVQIDYKYLFVYTVSINAPHDTQCVDIVMPIDNVHALLDDRTLKHHIVVIHERGILNAKADGIFNFALRTTNEVTGNVTYYFRHIALPVKTTEQ